MRLLPSSSIISYWFHSGLVRRCHGDPKSNLFAFLSARFFRDFFLVFWIYWQRGSIHLFWSLLIIGRFSVLFHFSFFFFYYFLTIAMNLIKDCSNGGCHGNGRLSSHGSVDGCPASIRPDGIVCCFWALKWQRLPISLPISAV